jgi:hypothetical protein
MTRPIFAVASLTLALYLPSVAVAADWQLVAKRKEGSIYIDAQGIGSKDGSRKAWDKWEYADEQPGFPDGGIKSFTSSRHLAYYNCKERTFAVGQVIYLDAKGKSVGQINLDVTATSFNDVPPDSVVEAQLDFVCKAKVRATP